MKRFLDAVWKKEKLSHAEGHAIMNLCMAATYDPDPKAPLGFRLPFNLETGEMIAGALEAAGCKHDPIHLVARHRDNLRTLRGIYIDCGWRDQYHIHYGARILSQRLARGRHPRTATRSSTTTTRTSTTGWTSSLPFLYRALKP